MQQPATARAPRRTSPYLYTAQNHPDARTILNAVVSGVDISLVDPKLFPQIYDLIPNYILKFQDRGEEEIIEKLNFIQTYIEKYPERQRLEMMLTRTRKVEQPKQEVYTKDELNAKVNAILNGKPDLYYTNEQSEAIVAEFKRRKVKYAKKEEFDKADLMTKTMNKFIKLCEFSESNQIQSEKSNDLKQKLSEARQNHEDLKRRWKQVFDIYYEKFDQEYKEMVEKQNEEIMKLEEQREGPMPAKFHKYSSELLNLKQRNKAMVYSKRYNEASELQAEVAKLEEQEDQRNYQDWMASIDEQVAKAEATHAQQRKIRENNFRREEKCMKKTMKEEIEASEKLINNLNRTIKATEDQIYTMENENDELVNQKTRSALPPLNTTISNSQSQEIMTPTMFRQRAMLNMKVYTRRPQKAPPVSAR